MEAETPPLQPCVTDTPDLVDAVDPNDSLDSTIHGFNASNITVLERNACEPVPPGGDGSDSGVELPPGDAYEDAFARLARRNSTLLLQDLKDKDGSGSESSSTSSRPAKRLTSLSAKKKVAVSEPSKPATPNNRPRPSIAARSTPSVDRSKSKERVKPTTPRPSTLKPSSSSNNSTPRARPSEVKPRPARSTSSSRAARTPAVTPTADDGRWPSTSMTRSFRGSSAAPPDAPGAKPRPPPDKAVLDKYATLPRRRRERSADNVREREASVTRPDKLQTCGAVLRKQASRESTPSRSLPPCPKKKPSAFTTRTRIFCEASAQTSLSAADMTVLCAGGDVVRGGGGDRAEAAVQTEEPREDPALLELRKEVQRLKDELGVERREKQALQEELDRNMQRVQSILGNTREHQHDKPEGGDDSLLELESRFEVAGQVIIKQENEISELHVFCRTLQRELDCSMAAQRELEAEGQELQEFLAAEKATLSEALGEAEAELRCVVRAAEQRRQEALTLAARLAALEARSRDLLLAHGAAVSGAAVALAGLAHRLDTLASDLTSAYHLDPDADVLDDAVYHNEAYSPDTDTPDASTAPGASASFLASVMSAIRSAVTVSDTSDEPSEHSDMLDSETEPCLMMDAVLEDVVVPDTHTVNLVSVHGAGDSLHSLAQAILQRQRSEQCPATLTLPDTNAEALVDQVIEADNLLSRLLRVVRGVHGALAQQLRDWEALGARLKTDLATKAGEAESLRVELSNTRRQVERLTQDVCALSTACSEAGAGPGTAGPQLAEAQSLLQQHWREHYRQLDQALETLHECSEAVAATPALARLQRDLEAASFACATAPLCVPAPPSPPAPPDLNANAAAASATLINSTA